VSDVGGGGRRTRQNDDEGLLFSWFLDELPEVFNVSVVPLLDATDRAVMERVSRGMQAAVVSWNLPRVGTSKDLPFYVQSFLGTVEMIALGTVGSIEDVCSSRQGRAS